MHFPERGSRDGEEAGSRRLGNQDGPCVSTPSLAHRDGEPLYGVDDPHCRYHERNDNNIGKTILTIPIGDLKSIENDLLRIVL